jgi:hypothetical protein
VNCMAFDLTSLELSLRVTAATEQSLRMEISVSPIGAPNVAHEQRK